jgi:superfamily II DNA or RNA helicase
MIREDIQEQALNLAVKNNRCGLGISMGVGKTRIAIQHLQKNYDPFIRVLVVIPKNSVAKAWIDELGKMKLESLMPHITFSTYRSINKHIPNNYDIVYLDECHNLLETHEDFLKSYKGKILGLTGTPPVRVNSEKHKMVNKYCPIIYKFSVDDATSSDIINDYQIIVHKLQLSKLKTYKKKNKQGGFWYTSEEKDYKYFTSRLEEALTPKQRQFTAIMRMKALMGYSTKELYVKTMLNNINDKCLIFANTHKQADKLCTHSYHSSNKNSEENLKLFSDGRIDKMSCVLQISEGVSIPNLKLGIILHAYGNERKTAQRIGRLLRLSPHEKATCHILCYKDTQDIKWVESALSGFDRSKIKYFDIPLSTFKK